MKHTMKMVLLLFLAMLMCIPAMPAFSADEATEKPTTETAAEPEIKDYGVYDEAVRLLVGTGIISGELDIEADATRGFFASAIAKILGIGVGTLKGASSFSDVSAEDENAAAIEAVANLNIISGFGDGTFGPTAPVTEEQAAKMLTVMLGYRVQAESYGGYPGGYLVVASNVGLLKKVQATASEKCLMADAIQMLANALSADIMTQTSYAGEEKYETVKGKNPMTEWLGVFEADGVVSANEFTALAAAAKTKEDCVRINEVVCADNGTGIKNYLGYAVKLYYKLNDVNENEAITFSLKPTVSEKRVNSDDIAPQPSLSDISYYEGSSTKKMSISSGASFIYNGIYLQPGFNVSLLAPTEGSITFVDNDKDGKADTVLIKEILTYYVDSVSTSSNSVKDWYSQPALVLDEKDTSAKFNIAAADGKVLTIKKIKKTNVLSVTKSLDGSFTDVVVSTEKIKGTITETSDDSITVDGTEYKLCSIAKSAATELKMGVESTFYLSAENKIAGWATVGVAGKYGYLITAALFGKGLNSDVVASFRIFNTNGKINNYENAERFEFNGSFRDSSGAIYTGKAVLDALKVNGVVQHQLIKYDLNDEGKIVKLFTARNNTAEPLEPDEENFTLDYNYNANGSGDNDPNYIYSFICYYKKGGGIINNQISLSNVKYSFMIPVLRATDTMISREKEIKTFYHEDYFSVDPKHKVKNLKVYDMDRYYNASVIVHENDSSSLSGDIPEEPFFVVDYIADVVNEDGEYSKTIYGFNGQQKDALVVDTSSEDIKPGDLNLKQGDVIRVCITPDGVTKIYKVFSSSGKATSSGYLMNKDSFDDWCMKTGKDFYARSEYPYWQEKSVAIHCRAKEVSNSSIRVDLNAKRGLIQKVFPVLVTEAACVVYDEAKGTLRAGSLSDIDPDNANQTIVLRLSYQAAYGVVICNWKNAVDPTWSGTY